MPPFPRFTLRQLAYFVAAVDAGSIAAGANGLHVSPSALSDALQQLERALGEPLVVRHVSRGVVATPSGVRVLAHARRVLAEAGELEGALDSGERLAGPIAVGCHPALAPVVLPLLLGEFAPLHPDVDLTFVEETQDHFAAAFASHRMDVAFGYEHGLPMRLRTLRLTDAAPHLLLPADHPLAGRAAIDLREIIAEDLILLDASPAGESTLSVFAAHGLQPRVRHTTSSYEAVRTMVNAGLGYAMLVSRPPRNREADGRRLRIVEIDALRERVGIDVMWDADGRLPRRVTALVDFARAAPWPHWGPALPQSG